MKRGRMTCVVLSAAAMGLCMGTFGQPAWAGRSGIMTESIGTEESIRAWGKDDAEKSIGTGENDGTAEHPKDGTERKNDDAAEAANIRQEEENTDFGQTAKTEQETENGSFGRTEDEIEEETEELLAELGLSGLDAYMRQENLGQLTFSELLRGLMQDGLTVSFSAIGKKLGQILMQDYKENRTVLIQILVLAIAFSLLLQMTSSIQKNYISNLGFLGVYLILMMLILRLFMLMTGVAEQFFTKLVEFMQMLQPVFCMSMIFSTGSMSAGAYYQLLLFIIACIDLVFAKVLLPVIQVRLVLQLVNHMMEEERFSRIAGLLEDSVHWCIKIFTTAVIGLNIVQGLLAPGIDGLKRSTVVGAVSIVPGIGQIMNSMTEILAGSAMLIKNSVGAAALLVLIIISFLPLVKIAVFMLLYRGLAALMEPVSDKRFCAAAAALGQSAGLYLKLMFYAVLLFFLTTAIICAATTLGASV